MDLTQEQVARRIKTSTPYVGHLEAGKRHPSHNIVTRLAEVLGFEERELFCQANPRAQALLNSEPKTPTNSTWDDFRKNDQLQRAHGVNNAEMELLSRIALCGTLRSPRDFLHILNTIRYAVGRTDF
jgi:transcriptional regulator with XRE-family HTH domain